MVTEATLKLKIAEELNAGTYTKLSLEVRNTADPPVANSLAHSEPSNSKWINLFKVLLISKPLQQSETDILFVIFV